MRAPEPLIADDEIRAEREKWEVTTHAAYIQIDPRSFRPGVFKIVMPTGLGMMGLTLIAIMYPGEGGDDITGGGIQLQLEDPIGTLAWEGQLVGVRRDG